MRGSEEVRRKRESEQEVPEIVCGRAAELFSGCFGCKLLVSEVVTVACWRLLVGWLMVVGCRHAWLLVVGCWSGRGALHVLYWLLVVVVVVVVFLCLCCCCCAACAGVWCVVCCVCVVCVWSDSDYCYCIYKKNILLGIC